MCSPLLFVFVLHPPTSRRYYNIVVFSISYEYTSTLSPCLRGRFLVSIMEAGVASRRPARALPDRTLHSTHVHAIPSIVY